MLSRTYILSENFMYLLGTLYEHYFFEFSNSFPFIKVNKYKSRTIRKIVQKQVLNKTGFDYFVVI